MAISIPHYSYLLQSQLGWKEFDLTIADDSPDESILLRTFGEGLPLSGIRTVSGSATVLRIPLTLVPTFFSLVSVKADGSKAYIALNIDAANDIAVTITAVDETGGDNGGGGDSYHIAGTVQIDGVAVARDIVVIKDDPAGREVVAVGQSAGDGTFDISYSGWNGAVIALALDRYGQAFEVETALNAGTIIHPTIPNGYVYEVTVAGTTGITEPAWPTSGSVQSGSVTLNAVPYYRPVASGPITGEEVV